MGSFLAIAKDLRDSIERQLREDSWYSAILGLGGVNDKRIGTRYRRCRLLTPEESMDLFTGNDLARLICTVRPTTALRRGFTINIEDGENSDDERESDLAMRLEELGALAAITAGAIWGQTTGGGAILMGVDDGQLPEEPIRLDAAGNPLGVKKVNYLRVYDRRRLQIAAYDLDPTSVRFGQPSHYKIRPVETAAGTVLVHASRLIMFPGVLTGDQEKCENDGWDHSVLQSSAETLKEFGISWDAVMYLLTDASQAVYKVKNLNQILASEQGDEMLGRRMRATEMGRSVARALVIDADGEEFQKQATSFAGLPDMLDRLCNRLAAAARIPVSILMGQAPAGLNATGQADLETFYGEVTAWQRDVAQPAIRQLARIVMAEGGAKEPDVWRVEFKPVNPNHDKEVAELRKSVAETDKIYIECGVATPEEIGPSRFGADGYSTETTIDLELRRELKGETQEAATELEGVAAPGVSTGAAPSDQSAQNQALNGAQIEGLKSLAISAQTGELPRDTVVNFIARSFLITPEAADKLLGSAGKNPEAPARSAPPSAPSNQEPQS